MVEKDVGRYFDDVDRGFQRQTYVVRHGVVWSRVGRGREREEGVVGHLVGMH